MKTLNTEEISLLNWALGCITRYERKPDQLITILELDLLRSEHFENNTTFALPDSIKHLLDKI